MYVAQIKALACDLLALRSRDSCLELPRILTYHAISDDPDDLYAVSPALFRSHLDLLHQFGLRATSLRDFMSVWPFVPPDMIILTFDDATACQFTQAFPALLERGFGGTFFVPTAAVSGTSLPIARSHMNWSQVRELAAVPGFEVGSHTCTHPFIGSLKPEQAWQEVKNSKRELEDRLGCDIESFAYPFGRPPAFNASTRSDVAEAGYRWACTMTGGPIGRGCDLLELPRDGMLRTESLRRLKWRISGRYDRIQAALQGRAVKRGLSSPCVE